MNGFFYERYVMNNNDVIRNIRYTFDYNDAKMVALFELAEGKVSVEQMISWLKKDQDEAFQEIDDKNLAIFLNGFINEKRGKKEGEQADPETRLTNNIVLRKLKIALNLKDNDMLEIFQLAEINVSKPELSALFRKPSQPQYRECQDQFLRNFLYGMKLKYKL